MHIRQVNTHIDLTTCEAWLQQFMEKQGISGNGYCISVELWKHQKGGNRALSIRLTVFDSVGMCRQAEGADWQTALERLRLEFRPKSQRPGDSVSVGA